jgi:hypothetical protein
VLQDIKGDVVRADNLGTAGNGRGAWVLYSYKVY